MAGVLLKVAQFVHTEQGDGVHTCNKSPLEQLDHFLHLLWHQAATEVLRHGLQFLPA